MPEMPGQLVHIADRLFGRPLFVHPQKAEVAAAVLRERIGTGLTIEAPHGEVEAGIEASRFSGTRRGPDGNYSVVRKQDGVAMIPVIGSLVNRGLWLDAYSGMTSYEGIAAQVKAAAADPDVKAILLDIDSPGGEATGMFGLAAAIRSVRDAKRVVAVVNDMAASAAFGIAASADEIVISPTSIVGSIGVVLLHLDRSAEMAQKGIRATLIHAGAHKVDGHPFGPLSAEVAADMQKSVMTFYDRFVETIAEGRQGRLTAEQARATEARTYIGAEAIKARLADRMGTFDAVLAELIARPNKSQRTTRHRPASAPPAPQKGSSMNQNYQNDESFAAGRAAGVAEERQRISSILALPEAAGREKQVSALIAAGTDAENAKLVLDAAGPAAPKRPSLTERMAEYELENKALGASGGRGPNTPSASWDKHVERQNARLGE
ncbi:peptidase S46 [Kaistia algarum]|uniref:S49 family peptidase n=1 Tax=Kaistia algarum TaxID=2083279 RepID=UPI000CE75029|nr:S49 family peptidase [Kaistia algarum]MCX5513370.1 S49 family peptidase [Kaistia algarum]PPE81181.1 peptidase S46 [Kaistia algarum]